MTPRSSSRRRRQGPPGETLRCAVRSTSLGELLVAATARGVCAVLLGDDGEALVAELRRRFPRATLAEGAAGLARQVATLVEHPAREASLPLDVRGTAFQVRVWDELRRVPAGETVSYLELARRLGAPSAVRAVAGACGANPVAVAVPCHRVVRSDGGLSGYRWGVERKRALLEREAAAR